MHLIGMPSFFLSIFFFPLFSFMISENGELGNVRIGITIVQRKRDRNRLILIKPKPRDDDNVAGGSHSSPSAVPY